MLTVIAIDGSVISLDIFNQKDIKKLADILSERFGKQIKVDPLPAEFTEENLAKWAKYNLKPIFLPGEEISENRKLKNWVKPRDRFYEWIEEGKIAEDSVVLRQGWYLADFSIGVDCTNGTHVFPNDPLSPLIQRLRQEGKIGKYDNTPMCSRFSIIPENEWPILVAVLVDDELEIKLYKEKRIEHFIEFNAIGNLYDKNRGRFNMWEWFTDNFEDSDPLYGGYRDSGGLAHVDSYLASHRHGSIAGRPLVSF